MPSDGRVLNITRGFRLRRNQAQKAVDNHACAWVEYGVSIRNLTLAESIASRNEAARLREPLAFAELPGLRFVHPGARSEAQIARAAVQFAAECHA